MMTTQHKLAELAGAGTVEISMDCGLLTIKMVKFLRQDPDGAVYAPCAIASGYERWKMDEAVNDLYAKMKADA